MLLPLAPVSLIVQLFDAFLAFSLLFGSFLLYVQEGSAASIQVDMQIEAAARLKSTVSDLPALEISRNISFGAPPRIFPQIDRWWLLFPNDLRCGFRKLKERGVGNRPCGAVLVPKSLLLLNLLLRTPGRPRPDFTYTKNFRYQNLHGRDLQGQSAICSPCFGPRVALFPRTRAVGPQAIVAFYSFCNF